MEHGPATEWQEEKSRGFKTRLGFVMIIFYAIVYFAFIVIAVINPQLMAKDVGNLNVAIVYGFGIIILAIIQALIYNFVCLKKENDDKALDEAKEEAE